MVVKNPEEVVDGEDDDDDDDASGYSAQFWV